ncbi:hypothetical protein JXA32_08920 [Candidatus Sumerlaeota bacterium]|nr:hypothetical protein [Candidatus Sumerlaeota bacterium]
MDKLILPKFDIPESCQRPSKKLPHHDYLKWLYETVAILKETGRYEQLRNDPNRRPVEVPFVLKH